jgi:hypothetical protein
VERERTREPLYYHYVPHHDVPRWEAIGWVRLGCLDGTNHGKHSAMMEWPFVGECEIPERIDDDARNCA